MTSLPAQLDSHIRVVIPENIAFEYRVASPFERLAAYVIDLLIMAMIVGVIWVTSLLVFGSLNQMEIGTGLLLISLFVVAWFYHGLFETYWNGQTPGKRSMGLRVMRVDGSPINAAQAILRNFLRVADGYPFVPLFGSPDLALPTGLLGLVATASNRRYQRLGDLACGTMVIVEDRSLAGKFNETNDVILAPIHELLPANAVPSRSLARVLSRYVDRRRYFGPARRSEIARHVGQVLVKQYHLPPDIDHDALLCALYQRAFLSQQDDEEPTLRRSTRPLALSDEA